MRLIKLCLRGALKCHVGLGMPAALVLLLAVQKGKPSGVGSKVAWGRKMESAFALSIR